MPQRACRGQDIGKRSSRQVGEPAEDEPPQAGLHSGAIAVRGHGEAEQPEWRCQVEQSDSSEKRS
jgi:hypothetical protein